LLIRALALRRKLLHAGDADIAQSKNDLGEIYTSGPNESSGSFSNCFQIHFLKRGFGEHSRSTFPHHLGK
jgi:hypothetical protein